MKIKIKKINTGFTLVESLVAISILMVAIVTPMSIAQKGLNSAMYSKDQMTATFLAQDAIEFIKNKRDEIGLVKSGSATDVQEWIGGQVVGYLHSCFQVGGCEIDTISNSINVFNDINKIKIIRDGSGNFLYYGYGGAEESKFIRKIIMTTPFGDDEVLIDVTVSWQNGGVPEKVQIKNFIYNYWENL